MSLCAVCGDGRLDTIEECDDGDIMDGDGCDSECYIEDSFVCSSDPGKQSTCAECGDGYLDFPEECDDKDNANGDGCNSECRVEKYFQCSFYDSDAKMSLCEPICGDGHIAGDEECDDGNNEDDDGCDETCIKEDGYICGPLLDEDDDPIPLTYECSP